MGSVVVDFFCLCDSSDNFELQFPNRQDQKVCLDSNIVARLPHQCWNVGLKAQ